MPASKYACKYCLQTTTVYTTTLYVSMHVSMTMYCIVFIHFYSQNTKIVFLSISYDYNATSTHDKANLITYLCTQYGLFLIVVHNFCVNQPIL